ncbi:MAG: tetratricopeptide repeat protein [Desulfomonile tiedjei]|nr:tetratricopeptide repeat protein [Desulfomonile tiedjei]
MCRTLARHAVVIALAIVVCTALEVSASEIYQQALAESRAGRPDTALVLWNRVIQRNPKSYGAHVNRGMVYMGSGLVYHAIMDWHRARELSPLFAYGVAIEGFLDEESGNTALLNYAKTIELDPDYAASVMMTGSLYLDLGQNAKAVTLFRKSVELTRNPLLKSYFEYWIESVKSSRER